MKSAIEMNQLSGTAEHGEDPSLSSQYEQYLVVLASYGNAGFDPSRRFFSIPAATTMLANTESNVTALKAFLEIDIVRDSNCGVKTLSLWEPRDFSVCYVNHFN